MKTYNKQMNLTGSVMNANLTSNAFALYQTVGFAIQVVFTGTPTGSFKLEASCDPVVQADLANLQTPNLPVNWTDVPNTVTSITAAGSLMYNFQEPMFNWIRLVYTDTSGGTSTAQITSCVINQKGI